MKEHSLFKLPQCQIAKSKLYYSSAVYQAVLHIYTVRYYMH